MEPPAVTARLRRAALQITLTRDAQRAEGQFGVPRLRRAAFQVTLARATRSEPGDKLCALLIDHKLISGPRRCLQKLGRGRIDLDFLPQPVHELLQELAVPRIPVTPDLDE
jgi:hypothetical protein